MIVCSHILFNRPADGKLTIWGCSAMRPLGVGIENGAPTIYYLNDEMRDQEFRLEIVEVITNSEFNDVLYQNYLGSVRVDGKTLHYFAKY